MTQATALYSGTGSATPFMGPSAGTRDPRVAATEMAGLFYAQMLSEMQKTVPDNPFFSGKGEEVFRSLQVSETARAMAARRGDPLTGAILRSIQRTTTPAAAADAYQGRGRA